MSEIKIDADVPVPTKRGGGRIAKYPFNRLELHESFFIPKMKSSAMDGTLSYWRKKLGWKFKVEFRTEIVSGKEIPGVRIWRVK
jgi:hypothetical protein